MKDILKYLALAAGGYLLYQKVTGSASPWPQGTSAPAGSQEGNSSSPPATTPPPAANPAPRPSPALDIAALIRAASGKPGAADRLTFDQWNWFYQEIRGVPGPPIDDVFPGLERSYLMTLDEWKTGVAKFGV